MQLPNSESAIVPEEKLRDYLLSPTHPIGRYKASFFQRLGYEQANWQLLEQDIRSLLAQPAEELELTKYGRKFATSGMITGPNGRSAAIVAVWIILSEETLPRFVTAYPED